MNRTPCPLPLGRWRSFIVVTSLTLAGLAQEQDELKSAPKEATPVRSEARR